MQTLPKKIHVVAFDVPYPADYGGVIDIYHKVEALHHQGIEVVLHMYQYGREESKTKLRKITKALYYYKRSTFKNPFVGSTPYIVNSRNGNELLDNLLKDSAPILFEGLHCTYHIANPLLAKRFKIVRTHNIEHHYLGMEAILIKKPMPIDSLPGFKEGEVSIQDYGAQLATHLLDLKKNYNVLDACAAPGGKACHMNEIEEIKLTAVEADKQRVERINENLNRLGHTFKVINSEIKAGNAWWDKNLFDRILLDAPCSASGIVRRHIDIKWLRRPGDLDYFHEKQFQLLRASWEMLKPLGKLLYVTCSIFEKENRSVVNRFLKEEKTAIEIKIKFPKNINVDDNQLLPSLIHDGLFYVLFEKK